ncbi:MAG: DUF4143 domain-containing protein [Bacilli bacterium]|nr:DUF4143 domain-containing protein [Bacilli bacterium]
MERKIYNDLLKWKKNIKKPLLLYGSKQVGKTFSVIDFGKKNYKNIVYFNLDNNLDLISIIKREKNPLRLIEKLAVLSGETILPNDTLIILDNVNDINVVKTIKLFGDDDNVYPIIMITSRKDNLSKFKGEELTFKAMYPMDFEEFLVNVNQKQLVAFIKDSYLNFTPMPFHQVALELYNDYLITGGYPEVVYNYLNKVDLEKLESIKYKIIDTIKRETLEANSLIDIKRANDCLNSIASQLLKENKKFQYGNIKKGSRSKDYEASIKFLGVNSLVHRSFKLDDVKSPLSSFKDVESFKLYPNDVGLLYSLMHLNKNKFMMDMNVKRILVECNIANTLNFYGYSLYYYQSEGKTEINFVIQNKIGDIIPIEIVNPKLLKAKALSMFTSKFKVGSPIRITEENFDKKKNVRNIPVYAIFCLKDI